MTSHTRFRTGDQTLVREINLSLIMQRLLEHGSLSRAALADVTGLNKSTVSSLVQELLEMGFVHETGLNSGNVGRPSMMLALNPKAGFIVSGEIGVDFLSVFCTGFGPEVLWQHHEPDWTGTSQQETLDHIIALLHEAADVGRHHCSTRADWLGLALGVPGIMDCHSGTLLFAPNLKWEDVPLRAMLREEFGAVPIFVENEANLAALGEYVFGAAKGYSEVLFISAGVGLGGALVLDGQIFQGKTGIANEFGHMTMDVDGELCNCGNRGCWETQASQATLFRYIRQAIAEGTPSTLSQYLGQLSISRVVKAAEAGDQVARDALEQIGCALGVGIASLVNALNPDRIVFGGMLSLAGAFLLPLIEEQISQRALRWSAEATDVVLAHHKSDACLMGGVATVYQAVLLNPGQHAVSSATSDL